MVRQLGAAVLVFGLASAPVAVTAQTIGPPQLARPVIKVDSTADAPEAPVNGVTYLYSATQKCPTDTNGNEITVCVRRSPSDQFRIPKELRPDTLKPEYRSWALKGSQSVAEIGATGIGSCSSEGAGGATGCAAQAFEAARRENKARREAQKANQPQYPRR